MKRRIESSGYFIRLNETEIINLNQVVRILPLGKTKTQLLIDTLDGLDWVAFDVHPDRLWKIIQRAKE